MASPGMPADVTVRLIAEAMQALARVHEVTGLTRTDIVNRAIQLCEYFETAKLQGAKVFLRYPDGTTGEVEWQ